MKFKEYYKEYNMGLGKNIYLQKQIRINVVNYIHTLELSEEDKNKLIDYVSDDIYARKAYPDDIKKYVHNIMKTLGM
jgi:hypothetical protein